MVRSDSAAKDALKNMKNSITERMMQEDTKKGHGRQRDLDGMQDQILVDKEWNFVMLSMQQNNVCWSVK